MLQALHWLNLALVWKRKVSASAPILQLIQFSGPSPGEANQGCTHMDTVRYTHTHVCSSDTKNVHQTPLIPQACPPPRNTHSSPLPVPSQAVFPVPSPENHLPTALCSLLLPVSLLSVSHLSGGSLAAANVVRSGRFLPLCRSPRLTSLLEKKRESRLLRPLFLDTGAAPGAERGGPSVLRAMWRSLRAGQGRPTTGEGQARVWPLPAAAFL